MTDEAEPTGRVARERRRMEKLRERKPTNAVGREQKRLDTVRQRAENRQLPKHVRTAAQETGGTVADAVDAVRQRQEEDRGAG